MHINVIQYKIWHSKKQNIYVINEIIYVNFFNS